jgi:trehalose 6-phosphate phosphatase
VSPSITGEEALLAAIARDPGGVALFSDFDGTLSAVVTVPDEADFVEGARDALVGLAAVVGRAAIVSGRPAGWLARRLALRPGDRLELFGLHGLERWSAAGVVPVPAAEPYGPVIAEAVRLAEERGVPGMVIENKVFTVTLHWRAAWDVPGTPEAALALAGELAARLGLELRHGKASAELVPPVGIDKGTVVRGEGAGFGTVVFLGDDVGDLRAFASLDDLEAGGASVCRVAVSGPEAPDELLERADVVLSGPGATADLLARAGAATAARGETGGAPGGQAGAAPGGQAGTAPGGGAGSGPRGPG